MGRRDIGIVRVERDGVVFEGTYTIEGRRRPMITVTYKGRSKTTQMGDSPVDMIARLLLRELII